MESVSALESLFANLTLKEEGGTTSNKLRLLDEIRTAMGSYNRAQMEEQMSTLNLTVLFGCLDTDNLEQITSTCEILRTLMNVLDPVKCLDQYHEAIAQGFHHSESEVQILVMAHLMKVVETNRPPILEKYPDLRTLVIQQLAVDELSVAKHADKLLMKYAETEEGRKFFLLDEATDAFNSLLLNPTLSETKKFRVYETTTILATLSPEHFARLNSKLGLMRLLMTLSFKQTDDFLGQFNAIEILANLVGCKHGQDALRDEGVFRDIKTLCDSLNESHYGDLLLPGLIKFIGKVGAVTLPPEDMVKLVLQHLITGGGDYALRTVSAEAFAHIGSTMEGKAFYKRLLNIKQYFEQVRDLIFHSPTEFRVRTLEAMAFMFGSDEANMDCLPHWFNILFHDISELEELIRLPFPDMKIAGLHFLAAIAHLEWAQRHYLRGAGVIEFLTSRAPEPEKECVYAKYRLVQIIIESPSAARILKAEDMAQLKLYVHQGPFYAPAESHVATQGAGP